MRQRHSEKGSFLQVIRRQPGRLLALTSIGFLLLLAFASAATPAAADHFQVDVPANAPAGTPVGITITALDAGNAIDNTYQGTVQFSSSDGDAALPPDHTFTTGSGGDNGVFTTSVTLNTTGDQTVTATDTVDPITGTSGTIGVHGPLDHFSFDPIADPTAGAGFTVQATAEDEDNNPLGSDYTGTPTLTGNLNGSSRGCPGAIDPCTVSYANPPTVSNGVATWTGVTAYKAETLRNVTATSAATINITGTFTAGEPDPATVDVAAASDLGGTNPTGTITTTLPTSYPGPPTNVLHGDVADGGCVRHQGNLAVVVGRLPANEQWSVPNFGTVEYNMAVIEDNGVAGATPVDRGAPILLKASSKARVCTTTTFAEFADLLIDIESGDVGLGFDGSVISTSDDFTVVHNVLHHFTLGTIAQQTAGTGFGVNATAFDQFGNPLGSDYTGTPTLSGNFSPSARGCGTGDASPCSASYANPPSVSSGVATWTGVTAYKAETLRNVTATDGVTGTSNDFTVIPNQPTTPPTRFSVQPTLTQLNSVITPAVEVTVEDFWGNPRQGDSVSIALGANPGGGTLLGVPPTPPTTNASGIVTFANLSITAVGVGKTLVATVTPPTPTPGTTVTSNAFDIANQVSTCTGTCSATGSTPNNTATVDAFGLGGGALSSRLGPAASAQSIAARLGMTVAGGTSITLPPNTSCGNRAPIGDPFWVTTFESSAGAPPSYKVVARLDKSLVGKNPAASKFDICLGTINVNFPPPPGASPGSTGNGCTNPTTSQSWKTKDGSCAKFFNGYYWGLVGDYPSSKVNNTTDCPGSPTFPSPPPFNLFPGVYKKQKNNAGDPVITLCSPSPWDGGGGWR